MIWLFLIWRKSFNILLNGFDLEINFYFVSTDFVIFGSFSEKIIDYINVLISKYFLTIYGYEFLCN